MCNSPHFSAKGAEYYMHVRLRICFAATHHKLPQNSFAFCRNVYKSRHFPANGPDVLAAKQLPDACVACMQLEHRTVQNTSTGDSFTAIPNLVVAAQQSVHEPYQLVSELGRIREMRQVGIRIHLTTHGRCALVTLGLAVGREAVLCPKSLIIAAVWLSFRPEAASSEHSCFNSPSVNNYFQYNPFEQPPGSS